MNMEWKYCKRLLCVRLDNMGDVIMSGPALRALKETFGCSITLLTSPAGAGIAQCMPEIDDVIPYDAPWVRSQPCDEPVGSLELLEELIERNFDGAIIFTVFSQSALPAAMTAMMAGIPLRLAYSRENPYQLLTDWLPDKEPYTRVVHQVTRDLNLVAAIGATVADDHLRLLVRDDVAEQTTEKLRLAGIDRQQPYIVLHPGVSEKKREYPLARWVATGKLLRNHFRFPIVVTGSERDIDLADTLREEIGEGIVSLAGKLCIGGFVETIRSAALLISVNTSAAHIAAATQTPVVVLYALTNPQHTPWKVRSRVLPF